MEMNLVVAVADSVSFYRKVSSESGYDFLKFFVNGVLKGQWSGSVSWGRVAYPVSTGDNILKWVYEKDGSVSTGSDCAWVDYIVLPAFLSVSAGSNGLICEGETFTPAGNASNYTSVLWTTSGTGSFSNPGIINPVYTPGANDISAGSVILTITAQHSSYSLSDSLQLQISPMPIAYAGPDTDVCTGSVFVADSAIANHFSSVLWTTNGDGTFSHPAILNPTYTPGTTDLNNGSVILTLTANANAPCSSASDELTLLFVEMPGSASVVSGPDSVDLFVHSTSVYTTDAIPQAQVYDWVLEPSSAGTITGNGVEVSVLWNTAFSGLATIKVCGVNACGSGEFSEEKTTWVYDSTVDVPGIDFSAAISLVPNPSDGLFWLSITNYEGLPFSITVFNLLGSAIYKHESLKAESSGIIEINLGGHPKGMYLLVFRSNHIALHKKLVIGE